MKVLRLRVLSNGLNWRIQKRVKFLCFEWWEYIRHPYGTVWEWDTEAQAKEALDLMNQQIVAREKGWSEVEL